MPRKVSSPPPQSDRLHLPYPQNTIPSTCRSFHHRTNVTSHAQPFARAGPSATRVPVFPCQRARAREKQSVRINILGNKKCSATATIPTIARTSKPDPASAPANATHPLPHPLLLPENQRSIPPPVHVKTHLACVHPAHDHVLGESSINRSNKK